MAHADEREVDGRLLHLLLRRAGGSAGRAHLDGAGDAEAAPTLLPRRAERGRAAYLLSGAAAELRGERRRGDADEAGELHGGSHSPSVCGCGASLCCDDDDAARARCLVLV